MESFRKHAYNKQGGRKSAIEYYLFRFHLVNWQVGILLQ